MTREGLAQRQAELLRALLDGGEPPDGFDERMLAVEARSLRAKRRSIVANLRPGLAIELGDRFAPLFDDYARERPRTDDVGYHDDAAQFVSWLVAQGEPGLFPERSRVGRRFPLRRDNLEPSQEKPRATEEIMFWKIVGGLLLAWVAFMVIGSVVGFLVKAVFWIAVIAGAAFLGTAAYGAIKGNKNKQLPS